MSDDNTAICMVTYDIDLGKYVGKSWTFIPKGRMEDKSRREKISYEAFCKQGVCIACEDEKSDKLISYKMIEEHIASLERVYGVKIKSITYDRYNAISSMQKMEELGYDIIEQKQFGSWTHGGVKKFRETIISGDFLYEPNRLLEMNIMNAKLEYDADLKMKVNKKRSRFDNNKIDITDGFVNIFCTLDLEEIEPSAYEDRGLLFL